MGGGLVVGWLWVGVGRLGLVGGWVLTRLLEALTFISEWRKQPEVW